MTRLYLVRHGETRFNAKKKIQGSMDIPLSNVGIEQAKKVARRFNGITVDLIYSSELLRAKCTAESISEVVRRPIIIDPNLNEMRFGIFEGMTFEEIARKYPDMWEQREKNKLKYTAHKGDSLIGFRNRVMKSIHRILYQFPKGDIIIVSHGGTNRAIMCALLGLNMKKFHLIRQDNTCINILDVEVISGKRYVTRLWSINDTLHLTGGKFPQKHNF